MISNHWITRAIRLLLSFLLHARGDQWLPLGTGVGYQSFGTGANVLITYAGWSVDDTRAREWTARVIQKSPLADLGVSHVYSVRGPRDTNYSSRELSNSHLIKHLLANQNPSLIVVAAHSSGAFVANELFQHYGADSTGKTNKKIVYYDLDGAGGVSGLTRSLLAHEYFVYARSGSLYSMNAGGIRLLGSGSNLIEIDARDSGCRSSRCLHDVMIIVIRGAQQRLIYHVIMANTQSVFMKFSMTTSLKSLRRLVPLSILPSLVENSECFACCVEERCFVQEDIQ